jgi:hypothetical protein
VVLAFELMASSLLGGGFTLEPQPIPFSCLSDFNFRACLQVWAEKRTFGRKLREVYHCLSF